MHLISVTTLWGGDPTNRTRSINQVQVFPSYIPVSPGSAGRWTQVSFQIEGDMKTHRADLKNIARRAMIERDLLPDFSAAAMAEVVRIQAAATDRHSDMRDLTGLLWASIDNDDSRDLDQLTVAEPHPDRSVTILVAIADVDALVTRESALDAHARHNTTSV